jgi:peptidoglycan/xylan/chitin deacetylase (PgdA/CDA1 family)
VWLGARLRLGIATTAVLVALGIGVGATIASGAGEGRKAKLNDPADASGPVDIRAAGLGQVGRRLVFRVRTAGAWGADELDPSPRFEDASSQFLCLALTRVSSGGETRLCPGGSVAGQVGVVKILSDGTIGSAQTINATVARPQPNQAVVSLLPAKAGLVPGRYRWRVRGQWSGPECQPDPSAPSTCTDTAPDSGSLPFRRRPIGVVGCTRRGPKLDFHGPPKRKLVALTFDDGPSDYTSGVLRVLRDKHARGTFFELGQEVAGHRHVMQSILASGDEIGNHTTHHSAFPGFEDIANTNRLIRLSTGFTPCLFRPPGGAFDSGTLAAARDAHLKTILWDVDPRDWSRPGSSAIYARVVGATHPGAIIIMHDGGGDRSETVSALPRIIHSLRHHGYSFDTVSQLLGDRMIFGPVG